MIRLLFCACLALLALTLPAAAEPDRVSLLLGSRHLGASGFQEVNPGVFLTWEGNAIDRSVGVYRNSYGRVSVAATAALPVLRWRDGEASLFAGLAHYPGDGRRFAVSVGDVVPLAGLQVRHRNTFAQIIPMDGNPVDAVVAFGLTWRLEQ